VKYTLEHSDQPEFVSLPAESILHLKVDNIAEVVRQSRDGGTFNRLRWTFTILGIQAIGDGSPVGKYEVLVGTKIYGSVSDQFSTHERNQLRRWTEAVLDMGPLREGFQLDTDLLIGRKCRGTTKVWTGTQIDTVTGKPKSGYEVESLLPPAKEGTAQQPAQQPAQEPAQRAFATSAAGTSATPAPEWNDVPF